MIKEVKRETHTNVRILAASCDMVLPRHDPILVDGVIISNDSTFVIQVVQHGEDALMALHELQMKSNKLINGASAVTFLQHRVDSITYTLVGVPEAEITEVIRLQLIANAKSGQVYSVLFGEAIDPSASVECAQHGIIYFSNFGLSYGPSQVVSIPKPTTMTLRK